MILRVIFLFIFKEIYLRMAIEIDVLTTSTLPSRPYIKTTIDPNDFEIEEVRLYRTGGPDVGTRLSFVQVLIDGDDENLAGIIDPSTPEFIDAVGIAKGSTDKVVYEFSEVDDALITLSDVLASDNSKKAFKALLDHDPIYQEKLLADEAAAKEAEKEAENKATRFAIYYNYSPSDADAHTVPADPLVAETFDARALLLAGEDLYESEVEAYHDFANVHSDKTPVLSRYFVKLEYDLVDPNNLNVPNTQPFKATIVSLPSALSDLTGLEVCLPLVTR